MQSKVVNMADRLKDSEDAALEALFKSEPIADDGFSARVVARVRRRIWVRRLALPTAVAAGAAIAGPAVLDVASVMTDLVGLIPFGWLAPPTDLLPQASVTLIVGAAAVAALFAIPALED